MLLGRCGQRQFDVLERQLHLVGVELLGPRPEARPLEFPDQMLEPGVAGPQLSVLHRERLDLRLEGRAQGGGSWANRSGSSAGGMGRVYLTARRTPAKKGA